MRFRSAVPALCLLGLVGCWTGSASPTPRGPDVSAADPQAPCPTRLVAVLRDRATQTPLAGATVVVATDRGRVAYGLTDPSGRFETAAVHPPAKLVIYYGETIAESPLTACQPPLRLAVGLAH